MFRRRDRNETFKGVKRQGNEEKEVVEEKEEEEERMKAKEEKEEKEGGGEEGVGGGKGGVRGMEEGQGWSGRGRWEGAVATGVGAGAARVAGSETPRVEVEDGYGGAGCVMKRYWVAVVGRLVTKGGGRLQPSPSIDLASTRRSKPRAEGWDEVRRGEYERWGWVAHRGGRGEKGGSVGDEMPSDPTWPTRKGDPS